MNYYAEITDTDVVTYVYTSEHDAGSFEVRRHFEMRRSGYRWVYVEEPCIVGDQLDVDEDGCATVDRDDSDDVDPDDVEWDTAEGYDAVRATVDDDGWVADDGNAEVAYEYAESGREAAEEYVRDGDWGERDSTSYIDVWAWRPVTGYLPDGTEVYGTIDRERHSVVIEPDEPNCAADDAD